MLAIVAMFMFASCSEEVGIDKGTTIKGMVEYVDGAAAGAHIYIAYGATEATTEFDQVVVADENGNYHIDGLNEGDYYIDAVYTDNLGVEFNSAGYHVFVGGSKEDITVDFELN